MHRHTLVDPGGPLDLLGKLFPETMEKMRSSVEKAVNWISEKLDMLGEKIRGFLRQLGELTGLSWMFEPSAGVGRDVPNYELPRGGSILGEPPPGANPLKAVEPPAPVIPKQDLLSYLKPQEPAPAKVGGTMKSPPAPATTPRPINVTPPAPAATKEDLLNYLKPQSSNTTNTYNINVTAPGANGDDIAERIRRAFERKPLYDSDGALVPG